MAKRIAVLLAVLLIFTTGVMTVSGCGDDENGEAVNGKPENEVIPEPEPAEPSNNPLVGTYKGEYTVEGAVMEDGQTFVLIVADDMSITGEGVMPTGAWKFSISGTVSPEGDFSAGGTVEGTGAEVIYSGAFIVGTDPVTASGTWSADTGVSGSWTAVKVQ